MSDPQTHAPPRLLDDPELGADLRQDLELARANAPLSYDVSAGLARLEHSLAAGAAPATGTAGLAGGALGVRVLAWILGGSILVASAVGAGALLDQVQQRDSLALASVEPVIDHEARPEAKVAETAPGATTSSEVASSAVDTPTPDAAPDAPTTVGGGSVDPAKDSPRPSSASVSSGSESESDPSGPSLANEAKQINAARKALASDPARALEIIEAVAEQFPEGAMIQEREGYAVLALTALGRAQQAQSRGQAYLETWPNGTLSNRVREAIQPTISK